MEEPQPHGSQNWIIKPSDCRPTILCVCVFQAVINKDSTGVQQQQQQPQVLTSQPARQQVVITSRDGSVRDEADDQSQSFLKKKEEELRQKRERERQTVEARLKQAADATFAVAPSAGVKVTTPTLTPTLGAGVISKLEFVAVTTPMSPTETVSTSLISAPVRTAVTTTTTDRAPKAVSTVAVPSVESQPVRPLPGANIPQFYFPLGTPTPGTAELGDSTARRLREEFDKIDGGKASKTVLGPVVKVLLQFFPILMTYLVTL